MAAAIAPPADEGPAPIGPAPAGPHPRAPAAAPTTPPYQFKGPPPQPKGPPPKPKGPAPQPTTTDALADQQRRAALAAGEQAAANARVALLSTVGAAAGRAPQSTTDAHVAPSVGDKACACGRWRDVMQDICQCGNSVYSLVCEMTSANNRFARSNPNARVKPPPKPLPPTLAAATAVATATRPPPTGPPSLRPIVVPPPAAATAVSEELRLLILQQQSIATPPPAAATAEIPRPDMSRG
jgi:hypothetical protein